MSYFNRKKVLLQRLEEEGSVNIVDIAEELNVSSMTVRRDLMKLSKEGIVHLEHGGAILNTGSLFEYNMNVKKERSKEEKVEIAKKCLSFIKEGDSIFLDAGTTNCEIAKLIVNKKNLNVVTNSLLVANTLSKAKNIRLVMCPGVFRETSMAFMGQLTDSFMNQFIIDVCFLGVEGVDLNTGVSVPDMIDGATKRHLSRHAEKVICVADSTKFGKKYFYNICSWDEIDYLATDSKLDVDIKASFFEKGIKVI